MPSPFVKPKSGDPLEVQTVSGQPSIDLKRFVSRQFIAYEIHLINVVAGTNAVTFSMRMFNGNGVIDTGSVYSYEWDVWTASAGAVGGTTATSSIQLSNAANASLDSNNGGYCGKLTLYAPLSKSYKTIFGKMSFRANDGTRAGVLNNGRYEVTTPCSGVQFFMSSGTISGTIVVTGIPAGYSIPART